MGFFGCDPKQIDSEEFWRSMLEAAVSESNILVLDRSFYKFEPQGVTGFLLLEASHVSVHTWPELGYVACDVFTCAPYSNTQKLTRYIVDHLDHDRVTINGIRRGFKFFDYEKYVRDGFLEIPIFADGNVMRIEVKELLDGTKSDYQDIMFLDTEEFGKSLVIDGIMQATEKDHSVYDKAILDKLGTDDERILIMGGGDGFVAETALEINPGLKMEIVDIDAEVVKGCEKFFNQSSFKDKRVGLCIGDIFEYLKNYPEDGAKFDGIVADLTDEPARGGDVSDFGKFYDEVFALAKKALRDGGWISMQAGASKVTGEHIDAASILKESLERNGFKEISRKDVMIPSFGESNAFLYAIK